MNFKQRHKNFKIKTRLSVAAITGLILTIILSSLVACVLRFVWPTFYDLANITTNSYSLLNQVQWNQAVLGLNHELVKDEDAEETRENIEKITAPIDELGTKIYIAKNGEDFYSNSTRQETLDEANSIVSIDTDNNTNYFGSNGMVIVGHINSETNQYTIVISNANYTAHNITERYSNQDIVNILLGRGGLIILIALLILALSITVVSIITAEAITKPIQAMAKGANEIANGNLDYVIDYESTNEIGTTTVALNEMTKRLKKSIQERDLIDASRKEMIAGVAHDLRTPLTSIKGYVEGLRDGIANTPEKQQQYLQTIYSSALDIEKLLNELQIISRLELGKIDIETEPINLDTFLTDFVEETRLKLDKHNYKLNYVPAANTNVMVELDTNRFYRVLVNIISNAVKYSTTAREGEATISVQVYEKSVIISVEDNGIGISNENLKHIFDTFYRADQARTRASEGSGIGLSVCKAIVELHGGHIWATSEEGKGTTILISLQRIEDKNE